MIEFDLWTFNSKVFPAIESLVARTGERVRVRIGNLVDVESSDTYAWGAIRSDRIGWRSMAEFIVASRKLPKLSAWGRRRDIEFVAEPGDWAFHCHMAHHTMNAMGHDIPNTLGVDQARDRGTD